MTDQIDSDCVPDLATRPRIVKWALAAWLVSGCLLIALGVLSAVTTALGTGWHLGRLTVAVIVVGVGLIIVSLSRKACRVPQWRGSLAALTLVATVVMMVLSIGFGSAALAVVLFAAVIGLVGSVLAYRPEADAWFNCREYLK